MYTFYVYFQRVVRGVHLLCVFSACGLWCTPLMCIFSLWFVVYTFHVYFQRVVRGVRLAD